MMSTNGTGKYEANKLKKDMKKKKKDYTPYAGFYDLRAFKLPWHVFLRLWRIQSFLSAIETDRRNGKIHPQMNEIKATSAEYQQCLLQFPIINKELIWNTTK